MSFKSWLHQLAKPAIKRILKDDLLKTPVLTNSIPKSGTHLLSNMLFSIPYSQMGGDATDADKFSDDSERFDFMKNQLTDFSAGSVVLGHIPYSQKIDNWLAEKDVKHVFVVRDPRDVAVSMHYYVMKSQGKHFHYPIYSSLETNEERLLQVIEGFGEGKTSFRESSESIPNLKIYYEAYFPWIESPNTYVVKFEDLINPEKKYKEVQNLLNFLEITPSNANIDRMIQRGQNPKKSSTFRKGKKEGWRDEFQAEHIEAFERVFGSELLRKLGYEI
ncbi:MAG: hypothetical protein ACJAWV_001812 [Flammeovirgaceae bacterium]|jgi:hypothetical protein